METDGRLKQGKKEGAKSNSNGSRKSKSNGGRKNKGNGGKKSKSNPQDRCKARKCVSDEKSRQRRGERKSHHRRAGGDGQICGGTGRGSAGLVRGRD